MQFRRLEMLVAVVEEGGVGRAASRLFITQPAVSGNLKKLSDEVGCPIFSSSSRMGIKLTPIGTSLYEYALRLLALRDEALRSAQSAIAAEHGRVRVGADEISSLYLLPTITERFYRHYPRIKLQVHTDEPDQLFRLLREDKIDVSITARQPIEAFESASVRLNVSLEAGNVEMIKKFVSRSMGVAIVPKISVQSEADSGTLTARSLDQLSATYQIWAGRRDVIAHRQGVSIFLDHLRSIANPRPDASSLMVIRPVRAKKA